jgi:hypothetical protein
MAGKIGPTSSPLENLEPHKCLEWKWIEWNDLVTMVLQSPQIVFDPLRHFIESAQQNDQVVKNLFKYDD